MKNEELVMEMGLGRISRIRSWAKTSSFILLLLGSLMVISCEAPGPPIPRKHGYPRIQIPQVTEYEQFDNDICPFTFDYPAGGNITRNADDSCWVDIHFPSHSLKWHITYRHIPSSQIPLEGHLEEHRKLIYKHGKKATQIKTHELITPSAKGVWYEVYGNVGTPAYYFMADHDQEHLFMMSFYFNTALKNDSLAPVISFMKGEVMKMAQSLEWEE